MSIGRVTVDSTPVMAVLFYEVHALYLPLFIGRES